MIKIVVDTKTASLQSTWVSWSSMLCLQTGAVIHLQCTYDTTNKTRPTAFGMRASDEMCNLFYTYYSDNGKLVLAAGR